MAIDATDLIMIRSASLLNLGRSGRFSPRRLFSPGEIAARPISELEAVLGLPAGNVISAGVLTLAITDGANVAVSAAGPARFQRIGNTVFVSGSLTVDTTLGAPTATDLNIALPIASALAAATELSGTIVGNGGADVGTIVGDAGTDDALAAWSASHTDVQTYTYQFSYEVL